MSDSSKWRTVRLDELCDINPPKPKLQNVDDAVEALFVPMAAIDEKTGTVTGAESSTIGLVGRKSYRSFTSGDVLFAKITPCMENGKAAVVPPIPTGLGFGSTEFHVLRPKPGTDARFIWHLVRQQSFRDKAAEHFTGSVGQLRVPADFLRSFEAFVPVNEQDQIDLANLLDNATASASRITQHLNVARGVVKRFRRAVLAAACSGRLTADWRDSAGSTGSGNSLIARIHRERVERMSVRAHQVRTGLTQREQFEAPFEVPDSWTWASWNDVADWITYGFTRPMPHVENGIPVITAKNIIDGRIDFSNVHYTTEAAFKSLSKKDLPQQGEILLTKDGSIGRAAVVRTAVPFCVNQSVAVIRFGSDAMSSEYLLRVIEAPFTQIMIDEAARGSAIRHIAITSFGRLPVPVPPFEEQVEIARRVGKLLSLSAALMEQVDNIAKTIERSSQAVLAKAFRGGLTGFEAVLAS